MYIIERHDFKKVTGDEEPDVEYWLFKNGDVTISVEISATDVLLDYTSTYLKEHDTWNWKTVRTLTLQDVWSSFARSLAAYNIVCIQKKTVEVLPLPDMEPPCI